MSSEQELSYAHFGYFCNTNSLSHVTYLKYFAQKQEGICPLWMSSEGCLEGMSGRLIPILQINVLTVACTGKRQRQALWILTSTRGILLMN